MRRLQQKLDTKQMSVIEPLFTLRAQDELASATVRFWCSLALAAGVPAEKIEEARKLARLMDEWPEVRTPGRPDTLHGRLGGVTEVP